MGVYARRRVLLTSFLLVNSMKKIQIVADTSVREVDAYKGLRDELRGESGQKDISAENVKRFIVSALEQWHYLRTSTSVCMCVYRGVRWPVSYWIRVHVGLYWAWTMLHLELYYGRLKCMQVCIMPWFEYIWACSMSRLW